MHQKRWQKRPGLKTAVKWLNTIANDSVENNHLLDICAKHIVWKEAILNI